MLEVLVSDQIQGNPSHIAHLEDCYHINIIRSKSQSSNEQQIPSMKREINRNSRSIKIKKYKETVQPSPIIMLSKR
jgi:hypothetical protein